MIRKFDVEKLKKNLASFRGANDKTQKVERKNIWFKPDIGEHEVYLLPWMDQGLEEPFKFKWFYFKLSGALTEDGTLIRKPKKDQKVKWIRPPLTLRQFGESDPVQEMIEELHSSPDPKDKENVKNLYADQAAYIPVIVKGQESLGVQIWVITSKTAYKQLMTHFAKFEKFGLLNDPMNERWVTITVVEEPKKPEPMNKRISLVTPSYEKEPLSNDPEQVQKWLENVPDLDEALKYQRHDYNKLKEILVAWSKSGVSPLTNVDEEGTEHRASESSNSSDDDDSKKMSRTKKTSMKKNLDEALKEISSFDDDEDE